MNVLVEIKQSVRVEQISNSKHIGSFAALSKGHIYWPNYDIKRVEEKNLTFKEMEALSEYSRDTNESISFKEYQNILQDEDMNLFEGFPKVRYKCIRLLKSAQWF